MNIKRRRNSGLWPAVSVFFVLAGLTLGLLGCQSPTDSPTVSAVKVTPSTVSVAKGGTQQFTAVVIGSNNPDKTVNWTVEGKTSSSTTISTDGLLAIAADETAALLTVTATSVQDPSKSDTVAVTVTGGSDPSTVSGVTVTPSTASVAKGNTQQFTATVAGTNNPAQTVNWTVEGKTSSSTTISAAGLLTVAADETAATLTVRATSSQDTGKSGTATVTVTGSSDPSTVDSVTVDPKTADVAKGGTKTFTAEVIGTNSPAQTVNWTVEGKTSPSTTISTAGILTVAADETATALTVTATSTQDTSKFDTAAVTVTGFATVSGVTVTPSTTSVAKGDTQQFTAAVAGTNNPAQTVTWTVTGNIPKSPSTTISPAGLLTVAADEAATTLTVTATSTVDTTMFDTATVAITGGSEPTVTGVTVTPSTANVAKGGNRQFTATVNGTNSPDQTVNWTVEGTSSSTTISNAGLLTIATGETAPTLTVRATSTQDTGISGTATVTVTGGSEPSTVTSVTVSPSTISVAKGGNRQFTATVNGTNSPAQTVNWTVEGTSSSTTISNAGLLTIATGETAPTLTVRATSLQDTTKSGTATVTVTGGSEPSTVTSVTVNPSTISVAKSGSQQFNAVVDGTNNPAQTVNWTVEGTSSSTTISNAGLLTIATGETAATLTVRATSTQDPTKSGAATVTVTGTPTVDSVTIDPKTVDVAKGGTKTFTATVTGTNNPPQTVTWTVEGKTSSSTTISATGLLTVATGETATTLTVKATSIQDTSKFDTATVTVTGFATVSGVTVSPATASVDKGGNRQFNATVTGTNNPPQTVTWAVEGKISSATTISATGFLTIASGEAAATLTVRATSTQDTSKSGTASVDVITPIEVLTGEVIINGSAQAGNTLTANTSNLKGSGAISYQWKRGDSAAAEGTLISGATAETYVPDTQDVGKYLKVTVTRAGTSGSVTSSAIGAVQAAPAVTGTLTGSISVTNGIENVTVSFTNAGTPSLSTSGSLTVTVDGSYQIYRWYVDNALLSNETGKDLILSGANYSVGTHRILVIVYKNYIPYSQEIKFTVN